MLTGLDADRAAADGRKNASLRNRLHNFLIREGFMHPSVESPATAGNYMPLASHARKATFSLPRDYLRRRRLTRQVTNVAVIFILSMSAAYVITRPTSGGTAFSIPLGQDAQLAAAAAVPARAMPNAAPVPTYSDGYHLQPGPFPVKEIADVAVHDDKRNKDIHMRVFYPTDLGRFPVIIFSHGAGGSQNCCEVLTKHWASYGYIIIQPTHDDSALGRRNSGEENMRPLQAIRDALRRPALWENRPRDITFVVDSLPELEKRVPALAEKIDANRIGVAGHSMGSFAAEAVAGATVDLPSRPATSFLDHRVKAVLCLSPEASGQFGLSDESFAKISVPYLGVTGSKDSLGPLASPDWHKLPFRLSPVGDKYHLFIDGANHMSFTGTRALAATEVPQADAILGYTNSAALAFWDAYLKTDARAKEYLHSGALPASSHGSTQLSRR
ncbi:MAG TPA: hypothetical protein VK525_13325 [Candidatus Saccharimonadales bacterium]|nr:hypothetical protein [Candidatus Saccharimonadales bacterium]